MGLAPSPGCIVLRSWWPLTWQEMWPGLFQVYYALCDGVLGCF